MRATRTWTEGVRNIDDGDDDDNCNDESNNNNDGNYDSNINNSNYNNNNSCSRLILVCEILMIHYTDGVIILTLIIMTLPDGLGPKPDRLIIIATIVTLFYHPPWHHR